MKKKNVVVFVNSLSQSTLESIKKYNTKHEKITPVLLLDLKHKNKIKGNEKYEIILCDFNKPIKIMEALLPHRDRLLAITCHGEHNLRFFSRIIPEVPYLRTPTEHSLLWATDKVAMRQRLRAFDASITPKFTIVNDAGEKSIEKIKNKIKFPLVLKPAGLAASLLVSVCYHNDDLLHNLRVISRKIHKVYRESNNQEKPRILAEQMMEGEMYSVDAYVNSRGKVYFCPFVHVKTGRTIGFDDFFGYMRITPVRISREVQENGFEVAEKSIHALGLRTTAVHIELMHTPTGWKIIELSPRMGGFRHEMYQLAYGIDHNLNDILIHMGQKPIVSRKAKGFTAVLQFFARKEGVLKELRGVGKIKKLESCVNLTVNKKIGDKCRFAKHGGKSICNLTLFNADRSELLADIRRAEQTLIIKT